VVTDQPAGSSSAVGMVQPLSSWTKFCWVLAEASIMLTLEQWAQASLGDVTIIFNLSFSFF
jgi:hypothetical protein